MSGYIGTQPVPQATQTRQTFTATASQTSFATGGYQAGYLDVFLNGVKLVDGTDYTATNGSDVVLTTGAASGDVLDVVAYTAFEVLNQNFTGGVTVDNDGATVLTVDRATSDGTIIDVQKDGSSVGSIGTDSNNLVIDGLHSENKAGIGFGGGKVFPRKNQADNDNGVDLGDGSRRFKDLYLSGGVYLGGTGSANKLDDYEEGTWTPVISATNGFSGDPTPSSTSGKYTKIGNFVRCTGVFNFSSAETHTGFSYVGGLPFLSNAGAQPQAAGIYNSFGANDQNPTGTVRVGITSSQFSLVRLESAPNASNDGWIFAFSYHTDA